MAAWRYKLPCGHHSFVFTKTGYWCELCGDKFDHLIDKKTNTRVSGVNDAR